MVLGKEKKKYIIKLFKMLIYEGLREEKRGQKYGVKDKVGAAGPKMAFETTRENVNK